MRIQLICSILLAFYTMIRLSSMIGSHTQGREALEVVSLVPSSQFASHITLSTSYYAMSKFLLVRHHENIKLHFASEIKRYSASCTLSFTLQK